MYYQSPTHGKVTEEELQKIITSYMSKDAKREYNIIVGSDSQKTKSDDGYDFVSALIVHRKGSGGMYFWRRVFVQQKMSLKERIYREALMSLETSESFFEFFKVNGISKYDMQIHIDIGKKGETRGLINELTGMIRSNGYDVKIKPDSFGASNVADRHT